MRVLPYGDRALLVEVGTTAEVLAYVDALAAARSGGEAVGVDDVVPAAETVLVVADKPSAVPALRSVLAALDPREARPDEAEDDRVLEIPVRYDGPDLGDVASHIGLSEEEVVAAHTGVTWRVAFGGFAPGFGYLLCEGEDPQRLQVPRRESSRTKVPAGAVGLAGAYTGVYPRESPGGWQLIGTTEATMWDLDRDPPALLHPGARVRFTAEGAGS